MNSSTDRIEKKVKLNAPVARVWRAISDSQEFGAWFCVKFEDPFAEGATMTGRITYKGYEHLLMEITIVRMDPEKYFAYRWHPHAIDAAKDYSSEPTTLVEFFLAPAEGGTLLTIVETGFDQIPLERRAQALRANDGGWAEQLRNIERHVSQS